MALYKIEDFNPNYRQEAFDGGDVKGLNVYAGNTDEKIGSIADVLVDETGRFRYLVIDTGIWIFGKKVLLPVGRCRVDVEREKVYATGLASKEQADRLPQYDESMTVDYDYEEQVRGVYRTPAVEASAPVEASPPVEASGVDAVEAQTAAQRPVPRASQPAPATPQREAYTYEREPSLYQMNEQDHQRLRLYEEKLVASKSRRKSGDVTIGKRVDTETAQVSVPLDKERVVIERKNPSNAGTPVTPSGTDFREGEVARMEVYEESADVSKQAFVREEVEVKKQVEQETVEAAEQVRREELEVDVEGNPTMGKRRDI
ncbi:MAG: DUF2382 domain-containing protein [Cyanophyceae cyanobacterium]